MSKRSLSVRLEPGFTAELWSWSVVINEANSGKVEVVWQTSSFKAARHEQRQRARSMPAWCEDVWRLVDAIDFSCLPPNQPWATWLDDAEVVALERQLQSSFSLFSVFYAPDLWPVLPETTRMSLHQLISTLDAQARVLHEQAG